MEACVPTREEAFALLTRYNKSESLVKHALAVEGVMRYIARKNGADEEKWEVTATVAKPGDLAEVAKQGMGLLVSDKVRVTVGAATCGLAKGSAAVAAAANLPSAPATFFSTSSQPRVAWRSARNCVPSCTECEDRLRKIDRPSRT